jgi:hypothetical protein
MDDDRLRAARARLMVRRLAPAFLYNPAYRVNMVDFGIPIRAEAADERPTIRFHVPQNCHALNSNAPVSKRCRDRSANLSPM